jgi:hypothetical protein
MPAERPHPGVLPSRRPGRAAQAILLLGTPGAGKRPVAHYLAEHRGFVHLDFEDAGTRERYLAAPRRVLRSRLRAAGAEGAGVVITWQAGPPEQLRAVRRLRSLGVEPVWFDSDRGAALRAHFAGARPRARFRFVDSFAPDGGFRPVEAVVADLLGAARPPAAAPGRALARPSVSPAR